MYKEREIYPNAPLEYVAAEVRYPYAPRLRGSEVGDVLIDQLADWFPVPRPEILTSATLSLGTATSAGASPISMEHENVLRLFNRNNTTSLLVTPTSLTIETTSYSEFPKFRPYLEATFDAINRLGPPKTIERVGLRFVNEIRVPNPNTSALGWSEWINSELVAPAKLAEYEVAGLSSAIRYRITDHRYMDVRVGPITGPGLIGDAPLQRRLQPPIENFFAIDIDSFWEVPSRQPVDFEAVDFVPITLLELFDQLHAPIGEIFQKSLTDKLRDEILRKDRKSDG